MTNDEIKHVLRDLTEVNGLVDRAIDWCECTDNYIMNDVVNRPTIDAGIVKTILSELLTTQYLLKSYMTELEARKQ